MMATRMAGRMWQLGGVLLIVLLIVATYLLAIKPVYEDKALKQGQVDEMTIQLVKLKRELADLQAKSINLTTYTAQLAAKKTQLPDSYDIPNYLRLLQDSDGAVKIDNSSVGVGPPTKVNGSAEVVGVPVSLTATGAPTDLVGWLDRLLHKQSRASLISSAALQRADGAKWSATVMLTLFCSKSADDDCKAPTT